MFISLGKSCFFIPPTFFNCFNLFIKNVLMLHRYNRGKSWLHSYINFFSICFVKKRLKKDMEKRSWKFWGNIRWFNFLRKVGSNKYELPLREEDSLILMDLFVWRVIIFDNEIRQAIFLFWTFCNRYIFSFVVPSFYDISYIPLFFKKKNKLYSPKISSFFSPYLSSIFFSQNIY
jgi:hypothetical protein